MKIQWRRKAPPSKELPLCPPDLLSEIKEMRSDMVLLKDLRAEVSQIREAVQRSTPVTPLYPLQSTEPANVSTPYPMFPHPQPLPYQTESNTILFYHQQSPTAVQEYQQGFDSGRMRGTAQFQQRFPPQRYNPVSRPRSRCSACVQAGEEYCQHCFKCGSSEHFRAGCRAQRPVEPARKSPLN